MSTTALHEQIDELGSRLAAVGSMAATVHRLAADTRGGQVPDGLVDVLDDLERDLTLASHEIDVVRDHAALERASLGDSARLTSYRGRT